MTLEAREEYISTTYAPELMILSSKLTCHDISQLVAKDRGICGLAYKYWNFIQLIHTQISMKVAIEYNVLALNEANTYLMEKGHAGLPPGQLEHVHTFDTLLLHPYLSHWLRQAA